VLSLRKYTYRYQFHQLGWTLLTILLIVGQSCAHISNIYSGIVWFLLGTTLVITNDVFAYIAGFFFGIFFLRLSVGRLREICPQESRNLSVSILR